jgi:putative tricarboxylic transport membrane protein
MKNLRNLLLLVTLLAVIIGGVVGCSSNATLPSSSENEEGEWVWERRIELVIPFGEGGGADTTARTFAPYLEKELGVSVVPNNISGASGINGAEYMHKQPADGYTIAIYTPSPLGAYALGNASFDLLNETAMVACLVQDTAMLMTRADSPFNNFTEFVEYAKKHPGELTISLSTLKGIDGAAIQQLLNEADIECTLVAYEGAETTVAAISGEVNATLGTPTDCLNYIKAGDLKPLVVLSEERIKVLPDAECTGELGYEAYLGPWRAIVCKKGTPQAAIDSLEAAITRISTENTEWDTWREKNNLNERDGFKTSEEMTELWHSTYQVMKEIFESMN